MISDIEYNHNASSFNLIDRWYKKMKKILIVEDDLNIQNILSFNLKREKYDVSICETGVEALKIVKDNPDLSLVLMDVMLPKMTGLECTKKIREFSNIPIVMLTALEGEENILKGFEVGVDDYVVKPFSIREVIARIKAHLKNSTENNSIETIKINNITLYPSTNVVKIGNKENELTDTELKLLMFFYKNPNKVWKREDLLKEVWGTEYFDMRTVDVSIRRLRTKIEIDDACPENLKTRRGVGYFLNMR